MCAFLCLASLWFADGYLHFLCRDADNRDVQFAADLAAWFSKARAEGKADVTVCYARDVKRPKGAKPGQALVSKERTHVGRPQNSAAAALAPDSQD